jgi:hypothetical protein
VDDDDVRLDYPLGVAEDFTPDCDVCRLVPTASSQSASNEGVIELVADRLTDVLL